jgi:hypothetical protein
MKKTKRPAAPKKAAWLNPKRDAAVRKIVAKGQRKANRERS